MKYPIAPVPPIPPQDANQLYWKIDGPELKQRRNGLQWFLQQLIKKGSLFANDAIISEFLQTEKGLNFYTLKPSEHIQKDEWIVQNEQHQIDRRFIIGVDDPNVETKGNLLNQVFYNLI